MGWETERGAKHQVGRKDVKQVNNCMYLGGDISENGRVEVGVRRRIQAGANAWRNVEGVMMDRNVSRKLKGGVLDSCTVPASIYGLDTLALSELRQHKLVYVRTTG